MGLLDKLNPFKLLLDGIGEVADRFITTGEEKQQFTLEMQRLALEAERDFATSLTRELEAKERVLIAELGQDDAYTKRARPTVVYVGLGAFVFNYVVVPNLAYLFGTALTPVAFPPEFWLGWSGIVATWAVGRSVEKVKRVNGDRPGKLVSMITG